MTFDCCPTGLKKAEKGTSNLTIFVLNIQSLISSCRQYCFIYDMDDDCCGEFEFFIKLEFPSDHFTEFLLLSRSIPLDYGTAHSDSWQQITWRFIPRILYECSKIINSTHQMNITHRQLWSVYLYSVYPKNELVEEILLFYQYVTIQWWQGHVRRSEDEIKYVWLYLQEIRFALLCFRRRSGFFYFYMRKLDDKSRRTRKGNHSVSSTVHIQSQISAQ